MTKGPGLPRMEGLPGLIGPLPRSHLSLHRVANAGLRVSAALLKMTHTCRAPSLFCLLLPSLPPFLFPKASASSSRLLYPSMHVTFSKKPPLASPRKEFLPQPLHSAEIKGAGSAARQPGVTPRLLHTPRHDSGASALPSTTAQRQFHKVLGRMK